MLIIITGGSGFIGTNLMSYYINKNTPVINVDIEKPRIEEHLPYWKNIDLMNEQVVNDFFSEINATHIIHLAARTDLKGKRLSDYAINYIGTQHLISALEKNKRIEKVIFTSTMLISYPGYIPSSDTDFQPTTVYGESKVLMEKLIRNHTFQYNWVIIRPTSIWGPWFTTPYKDFFDMIYAKRFYKIGNTECFKTYGFVLNSVFQIDRLLFNETKNSSVFYIGDQPAVEIAKWADNISLQMHGHRVKKLPLFVFKAAALVGDIFKFFGIHLFPMSSFRLKNMRTENIIPLDNLYRITGKHPYSVDEGIHLTNEWMKRNKN